MSEENKDHLAVVKQFLDPRSKYLNDPYAIAARSALLHYAFDIAVHDPALSVMLNKIVAEEVERERSLRSTPTEPPKVVHEEPKTFSLGNNPIAYGVFKSQEGGLKNGVVLTQSLGVIECPRCHVLLSAELEECPECGLDMGLV
jgi:hypothetical protein